MKTFHELLDGYVGGLLRDSSFYLATLNRKLAENGIKTPLGAQEVELILSGDLAVTVEVAKVMAGNISSLNGTSAKKDEFIEAAKLRAQIAERQDQNIFGVSGKSLRTPDDFEDATRAETFRRMRAGGSSTIPVEEKKVDESADDRLLRWRSYNPDKSKDKPSFGEAVETHFKAGKNFFDLIKYVVSPKMWGLQGIELERHMNKRLVGNEKISNAIIYQWLKDNKKFTPHAQVMTKIVKAFGLDDKKDPGHEHEVMLWKMLHGKKINFEEVRKSLGTIADGKDEGAKKKQYAALLGELIKASGVPNDRLSSFCGVARTVVAAWSSKTKPRHIEKIAAAQVLVELVMRHIELPKTILPTEVEEVRQSLVEGLTGKKISLSFFETMEKALEHKYPAAYMISYAQKPVGKSRVQVAKAMGFAKGDDDGAHKLNEIFSGRKVFEKEAEGLMDILPWKGADEYTLGMNLMTGFDDPKSLLASAIMGRIPVGRVLGDTIERRAETYHDVGISHTTVGKFIKGSKVEPLIAASMAKYIGLEDDDIRKFLVLATGRKLISADIIMARVESGRMTRRAGLTAIAEQSGLAFRDLSVASGLSHNTVSYYTRAGTIFDEDAFKPLAERCGIAHTSLERFKSLFCEPRAKAEDILDNIESGAVERKDGLKQLIRATGISNEKMSGWFEMSKSVFANNDKLITSPKLSAALPKLAAALVKPELLERIRLLFDPAYQERPGSYRERLIGRTIGAALYAKPGFAEAVEEDRRKRDDSTEKS